MQTITIFNFLPDTNFANQKTEKNGENTTFNKIIVAQKIDFKHILPDAF